MVICLGSWHWLQMLEYLSIWKSMESVDTNGCIIFFSCWTTKLNCREISRVSAQNILCNVGKFCDDFFTSYPQNVSVYWNNVCGIVFRVCLLFDWIQLEIAILLRLRFNFFFFGMRMTQNILVFVVFVHTITTTSLFSILVCYIFGFVFQFSSGEILLIKSISYTFYILLSFQLKYVQMC